MLHKLPVNDYKWFENKSQFPKDFIKNYNDDSDEGCSLEVMFNIIKSYSHKKFITSSKIRIIFLKSA